MKTQKIIQHRIGKYQVLGLLSRGSTSNVIKITQIEKQLISSISQQNQNKFEIVTIDMSYYRDNKITQTEIKQQNNKKDWVLKLYNLETMVHKQNNQFLQECKYDLLAEILFLTYLDHPGIIKAKQMILQYQHIKHQNNPTKYNKKLIKAGIVMQICQKGCFNSLVNYISRTKALKENKIRIMKFYLSQIANTLKYLNTQCKILHRDLKAQNIMLNKQLDIKIIDYGVSKINITYLQKIFTHPQQQIIFNLFKFDKNITSKQLYGKIKNHQSSRKNLIGSKHYISPQLVQKYRSDMQLIDQAYQKTDIWSFGVLMYKVFHDNKYPFEGRNIRQTLDFIMDDDKQLYINNDLPGEVIQIISICLKKDYEVRPTWQQLMRMDFFNQYVVEDIFEIISPIVDLLQVNRKQKQAILSNVSKIWYDQKLRIRYDNKGNKIRRVLILKQKQSQYPKLLILKQLQSISLQLILSNSSQIKIIKQNNYLIINYNNGIMNQQLIICNQFSKQLVDKLIQTIYQVFKYNQLEIDKNKNKNKQNHLIS